MNRLIDQHLLSLILSAGLQEADWDSLSPTDWDSIVHLAEFCLRLPWQWKTRGGWTKVILRRAMEPYLPSEVIWRKDKDSLMWEVNRLILKERAEYFYQITCDEQSELKTYIDINKLMKFWQEYLARGEEKHAELIWSGAALAMWLQRNRKQEYEVRATR